METVTNDDLIVLAFGVGIVIGLIVGVWLAVEILTYRRK